MQDNLKQIIQDAALKKYKETSGIANFLTGLDENKIYQETIWSKKAYKVSPESFVFTTIQERFSNKLLHKVFLPKGSVVVDVGCFIGEKLWQFSSHTSYTGIGLDISIPSLVAAKQIDIYGHHFIAADLENLPFKDASIDFLMVFDVIEHLSDQPKGFSEIARVLKPGGLFLLHIPIKDNKFSFFWWKRKLFPRAAEKEYLDVGHSDDRMLTTAQIKSFLQDNSLKLEQEIFYNSFLVHFFDRELAKLLGSLMVKFLKRGKLPDSTTPSSSTEIHISEKSIFRNIYGKYIVPILELLSFPDYLLSHLKIGNTYFVVARKQA